MLVIRIGPRSLALLGMVLALAVGLVIGSLRPVALVSAAGRSNATASEMLLAPAAQGGTITYEQAMQMIQAAMADARSKNYQMSFVVLDAGGHMIASGRMDGARLSTEEIQEKIREESLARHQELRAEDPLRAGIPQATAEQVAGLTGPFGNSTKQNRLSGLVRTDRPDRPGDRKP